MKKGLREFQQVYDNACESTGLALDLAQNLNFKANIAKPEYSKIEENDIHLAYACTGCGRIYPIDILGAVHSLAEALGFTKADYIDNSDERQHKGNVNIYIAGKGSINTDMETLMDEVK